MATTYWTATSDGDFTDNANWSGDAPGNNDIAIFNHLGTANVNENLGTSLTGVTLIVEKSYTGQIGSISGGTWTYLVLDGGTLIYHRPVGFGSPSGCPLCLVGFGSTAAVVNIYDSASSSSATYYPPLIVKGTSLTVNHSGGYAAIGAEPGVASTLTACNVVKGTGSIQPNLFIGDTVTTTALTASAGTINSQTTATQTAVTVAGSATYNWQGSGAHTTMNVGAGGVVNHMGTGTITTLNLAGTFDRTKDTRALTLSTTNLSKGARWLLDNGKSGSVTRSAWNLIDCSLADVEITLPYEEKP